MSDPPPTTTTAALPRRAFPGLERAIGIASLLFAGLVYAAALKYFVLPSKVILTGSEGIAAALSYYFESYTLFIGLYVVFQLALLSFAWLKVGRTTSRATRCSSGSTSCFSSRC